MSAHEPNGMLRCSPVERAQSDFDPVIARYISWASEWVGALPADAFFGVWADFQHEDCHQTCHG
jgi:hypothetical protein